jgi:hypothetical protein
MPLKTRCASDTGAVVVELPGAGVLAVGSAVGDDGTFEDDVESDVEDGGGGVVCCATCALEVQAVSSSSPASQKRRINPPSRMFG